MRSFDISLPEGRIIEARSQSVSRADCVFAELAGGRDPDLRSPRTVDALVWRGLASLPSADDAPR